MDRSTGGSSRLFQGGGGTWRRDPCQGTPKTKNSTDLNHYFLGRVQIHLESIRLANGQEVLKIIANMTEIGIFDVEEKCAFFIYESMF